MSDIDDKQKQADEAVLRDSRKFTRRSFAIAAVSAAAGYGAYHWIDQSQHLEMQPELLRKAFQINARLARGVFDDRAMAPTYPLRRAEELRVNGVDGLKQALVADSWRLQVTGVANARSYSQYTEDVTAWEYRYADVKTNEDQGHDTKLAPKAKTAETMAPVAKRRGVEEAGLSRSTLAPGTPGLLLTMDDILKFPKHEMVTQFKCIEGWSQIVHWRGVRMGDLIAAYPPALGKNGRLPKYVYMETPNGDYYVGYDMNVCLHPQTLLVTEMGGSPLTQYHGAPLRLHAPSKYGYKQIKRIGLLAYTDEKPDDYWTKLGYDWYAGL
jgi:DMSO/TMAO reductase YedYZ molybdopterin-dependent catalytic subunit